MYAGTRVRQVMAGCLTLAAVVTAGCGSSSSSSSTANAAATTATAPQSGASSGSSAVQAAAAAIAPYEQAPASIGVSQPLTRRPTGKTVDITFDGTPFEVQLLAAVEQAGKAIGLRVHVVQQQGDTPQSIEAALKQVVIDAPAAAMVPGDPTVLYQPQLHELHAKHIPVIGLFTNNDPLLAANVYGPAQYAQLGTLMADYVIAKSDGKAHVLLVQVPQIPGLVGTAATLTQTVKSKCSGCTVAGINTQLSDIGKNDPSRVVSYVEQNSDTNWIVFLDPDTEIGAPEALAAAGQHGVSMLSAAGGKVNYAYIKAGLSTVDASQPATFSGWELVDATARALDGQPVQAGFQPMEFLTKPDLTFNINQPWPDVAGYQQKFEQLWGVNK
jgi:ribose transport system substrate-binding protein